jgi:hypothetical protein
MSNGFSELTKFTTIAVALLLLQPSYAHHSDAGIDMDSVAAFEGTVN